MNTRLYFIINMSLLALALIVTCICNAYSIEGGDKAQHCLWFAVTYMSIYYLYRTGSFRYSRSKNLLYLLFSVYIIGTLFSIMHWSPGRALLAIPFIGLAVIYNIFFLSKPEKSPNSILKAVFINLYAANMIAALFHWYYAGLVTPVLSALLLQVTYIHFKLVEEKKPDRREMQWDFDKST